MELCATEESGKAELSEVKEEVRPRAGERDAPTLEGPDGSDGDRDDDGCMISLPPLRLCWFVDNGTMNGKNDKEAINFGKNGNNHSRSTVMATAEAFRKGVQSGTSTPMLLCPSHPTTGNPKLWLEAFSEAGTCAEGQKQVNMAGTITNNCRILLRRSGSDPPITWGEALEATFWDPSVGGVPNEAYVRKTPSMITVQGQNRATVAISVFAQAYGLSKDRAGRHGSSELFFGSEGLRETKLEELRSSLSAAEASFPATVFNFLSYKEASAKGRQSHFHQRNSRKPGIFAVIQQAAPFLQRVFPPPGVDKDGISSDHVDEALGSGWERAMYPSDEEATAQGKKHAREMQQRVKEYVEDELVGRGLLPSFKGLTFSTLVYACALKPGAPIVKLLLRRLRAEDEDDVRVLGLEGSAQAVREQIDLTARAPPTSLFQTLGQLFGLSARAQRSKGLEEKVLTLGVVNKTRTYGAMLAREDIVVALVKSLATRKHVENYESALSSATGVLGAVHDLVSEQDAERFSEEGGEALRLLVEFAAASWSNCTGALEAMKEGGRVHDAGLTSINKQAIKKSLGAAETEGNKNTKAGSSADYRRSNRSTLDPGYRYPPHIAVTAADIDFDAHALLEWHQHEDNPPKANDPTKGKRARTLASEFAALVVERFVAGFACLGGEDASARALPKFERLVGALDRDGLLFAILREDVDALSPGGPGGIPFFVARRLALMKQAVRAGDTGEAGEEAQTLGGAASGDRAGEARNNVRFTLQSENGADADGQHSFRCSVPDSVLRQLSLAGTDARTSATVKITLLDNGDGAGDGDEGSGSQTDSGRGSPAAGLSPTTSPASSSGGSNRKRGLDDGTSNDEPARSSKSARVQA